MEWLHKGKEIYKNIPNLRVARILHRNMHRYMVDVDEIRELFDQILNGILIVGSNQW